MGRACALNVRSFTRPHAPQVLLNLSRTVVAQLDVATAASAPPSASCAAALLALLPCLKVYQQYVSGYHAAQQMLAQLTQHDADFKQLLAEAEAKGDANERLGVLLVAPVRRLPNYGMYIERMIKLTPIDAAERSGFCQALGAVQELCAMVDASLAENQSRSRVAQLVSERHHPLNPAAPRLRQPRLTARCPRAAHDSTTNSAPSSGKRCRTDASC